MEKKFISVDSSLIDIYSIEAVSAIFNPYMNEEMVMFIVTLSSGESIQFSRNSDGVEELMTIRDDLIFKLL